MRSDQHGHMDRLAMVTIAALLHGMGPQTMRSEQEFEKRLNIPELGLEYNQQTLRLTDPTSGETKRSCSVTTRSGKELKQHLDSFNFSGKIDVSEDKRYIDTVEFAETVAKDCFGLGNIPAQSPTRADRHQWAIESLFQYAGAEGYNYRWNVSEKETAIPHSDR